MKRKAKKGKVEINAEWLKDSLEQAIAATSNVVASESRPSSATCFTPDGVARVSANSAAPFSTRGRL